AKLAVIYPRLTNTASMADYWLPAAPGTEAALLLGIAHVMLRDDLCDLDFVRRWTNWDEYLRVVHPNEPIEFDRFLALLTEEYAR
ncbi:MAG TPA: hypothetical protein VFU72_04085, partial [Nitrolancea sp.]|nr:hypothetical protein [Nitrolancea sp.]